MKKITSLLLVTLSAISLVSCFGEKAAKCFKIDWKNYDGTLLGTTYCYENQIPSYSDSFEKPKRESSASIDYTFSSWSPALSPAKEDTVYTALYKESVRNYTVSFFNSDGTLLQEEEYPYGSTPSFKGPTPSKFSTLQHSYKFIDWNPKISVVKSNQSYIAKYDESINSYLIKFVNWDGSILEASNYRYGEIPSYQSEKPTRKDDDLYKYEFNDWFPSIREVTGNKTYVATYTPIIKNHIVTWKNYDGTVLAKESYGSGTTPFYKGEEPTKPDSDQYIYTFMGWTPNIEAVKEDATYVALFKENLRKYKVTFKNLDGTILQQRETYYGETPEYFGATPTKEKDAQFAYIFAGWDKEISPVKGEQIYTATYTSSINSYLITFLNDDGTIFEEKMFEYGAIPETEESPTKESDDNYDYTFDCWKDLVPVKGEATYTPTFIASTRKYNVQWVNFDGSLLQESQVEKGSIPVYQSETPTREATAQYTFAFKGWDKPMNEIYEDTIFTATYNNITNKYHVRFFSDNGVLLEEKDVLYGNYPILPATPSKQGTSQIEYVFSGWFDEEGNELDAVTSNKDYYAKFEPVAKKYTIIFDSKGGSNISNQLVEYNGLVIKPTDPYRNGYNFLGWYSDYECTQEYDFYTKVTKEFILYAKWIAK